MAGCGVPSSHPSTRAESLPMGNNKAHLCTQGSTTAEMPPKRLVQHCYGALPRAGPTPQGTELTPGLTAHAGACKGFTWAKRFPGQAHCPPPAAENCHPARHRAQRATRCWGSAVFLPGCQVLAALQAKGELSSPCSLEYSPDESSNVRSVPCI